VARDASRVFAGVDIAANDPRYRLPPEYRVAKRPKGRVLLDYNQNAWGRTPASRLPSSVFRLPSSVFHNTPCGPQSAPRRRSSLRLLNFMTAIERPCNS